MKQIWVSHKSETLITPNRLRPYSPESFQRTCTRWERSVTNSRAVSISKGWLGFMQRDTVWKAAECVDNGSGWLFLFVPKVPRILPRRCIFILLFAGISVTVSVWTMVVISLERYHAICHPLSSRIWQTKAHAYKVSTGRGWAQCLPPNFLSSCLSDVWDFELLLQWCGAKLSVIFRKSARPCEEFRKFRKRGEGKI